MSETIKREHLVRLYDGVLALIRMLQAHGIDAQGIDELYLELKEYRRKIG